MPPQRDATHIAPYLTHLITHHGQITLVPGDNNGRRRKAKQRHGPREEPVRFSGAPTVPAPSVGRTSRRSQRRSRTEEQYNDSLDDIPDYPPPSFLEAISSPPVSVCPSTTTLGRFTTPRVSRHGSNSDSDSESDNSSLDIIDTGNLPRSPRPAERSPVLSQSLPRGRGILDPDPDDSVCSPSSSNSRSHRRHLSLSPLRTLFPSRNPRESGHALSAQSTPSPHSLSFSRSSPFWRSTTSLRNLTSSTPLAPSSPPSLRSESFLGSRRFFSHKGKERATNEALDAWEIVESELPAALTTPTPPEEASPVIDVSSADIPPRSPRLCSCPKSKVALLQLPPTPARERERRVPAPPPPAPALAPGEGPPIVTVRTRKPPPPPPPKKKPHPVSSPLRETDRPWGVLPELDLERAILTPLPLTPVTGSPTSSFPFSLSTEPGSPTRESNTDPDPIHYISSPTATPRSSSGASASENSISTANIITTTIPAVLCLDVPDPVFPWTRRTHHTPDFPQVEILHQPLIPSVPEGLLIDLDAAETLTPTVQQTSLTLAQPFASVSGDLDQLTPMATDLQRQSSASSVDMVPAAPLAPLMDMTDLDVLLARLENDHRDGGNYDDLWMISDIIGPATPVRTAAGPSTSTKTSVLLTGAVEVQRRRTTKDGRVKLKLALLGIAVDRCGICIRFTIAVLRGGW
ncbi:RING-type domain-containing protein [Mycena venus]|uniref:RING-type domain-containing protein n=1 Tax=Mycena venus TaxID=2733690 RepID=A0A8H7D650_9AGAR|nr:RING-type domain-containing protein [Mycena venus]